MQMSPRTLVMAHSSSRPPRRLPSPDGSAAPLEEFDALFHERQKVRQAFDTLRAIVQRKPASPSPRATTPAADVAAPKPSAGHEPPARPRFQPSPAAAPRAAEGAAAVPAALWSEEACVLLAQHLRDGVRNFVDAEVPPGVAAAVSFLVQHALGGLEQAQRASAPAQEAAMTMSLHTLAQRLQRFRGQRLRGFADACVLLAPVVPHAETTLAGLERPARGHLDAKLIQTLLKHLRDAARLDLLPYYYGVEDERRLFGFG